jgi:hypothetical protein
MGGVLQLPSKDTNQSLDGEFVVISNALETELHFNPSESHMLAFGIDKQSHDKYKHRSLGPTAKLDALETTLAFVKRFKIKNFDVFCSSDYPSTCSYSGIVKSLQDNAAKVGKDGLFVLFFSGHGINDSDEEWGLAPGDFDTTQDTFITMATLAGCLSQADCLAKYVLVILDCCYSGMMATHITSGSLHMHSDMLSHIYVMAAGTYYQSSLSVGALRHSIFSYFLMYTLNKIGSVASEGVLPLMDIFEECKVCCYALSSLVLCKDTSDDAVDQIKTNQAVPSIAHFNPIMTSTSQDEIDAPSYAAGRLKFLMTLFENYSYSRNDVVRLSLHPTTHGWLRSLIQYSPSPLSILDQKGLLDGSSTAGAVGAPGDGCILNAVIALIMQSIALIELINDLNNVGNPVKFLMAFVHTIATIDMVHPSLDIDVDHLIEGWKLYRHILVKNNVNDDSMKQLLQKIQSYSPTKEDI